MNNWARFKSAASRKLKRDLWVKASVFGSCVGGLNQLWFKLPILYVECACTYTHTEVKALFADDCMIY